MEMSEHTVYAPDRFTISPAGPTQKVRILGTRTFIVFGSTGGNSIKNCKKMRREGGSNIIIIIVMASSHARDAPRR